MRTTILDARAPRRAFSFHLGSSCVAVALLVACGSDSPEQGAGLQRDASVRQLGDAGHTLDAAVADAARGNADARVDQASDAALACVGKGGDGTADVTSISARAT